MIRVAGGTFQTENITGGTHEAPGHSVTTSGFYIDNTEITFEGWTDVRNWALTHGSADLPEGKNHYGGATNHPITEATWYDMVKWCNGHSKEEGVTPAYYVTKKLAAVYREGIIDLGEEVKWSANGYRLPTEAEWEFAARGGMSTKGYTFSGGNALVDVAWYPLNAGATTRAVGTKPANELGIFDMSGNVAEWCWDCYGDYGASAQTDPKGPTSGTCRLNRGAPSAEIPTVVM